MFRALGYFLTRGFKNIWGNRLMSVASVGIVAASLILFGIFLLAGLNINALLRQVEDQCEINVYLTADAGGATLNQIEGELRAIPGVREVRFFSREERLERAKETTYQGKEYMLEDLETDNPLRDSYILSVEQLSQAQQVASLASDVQGVDEVLNRQDLVERIRGITDVIQKIGLWMMLALGLVAMFIVVNTIRLGLLSRSREVNVMRFVGASNWYIRGPFMVEGILLGIIGAVLAAVLVLWGYRAGIRMLDQTMQTSMLQLLNASEVWFTISASFLGIGAGIGLLGSGISIRKYLKV